MLCLTVNHCPEATATSIGACATNLTDDIKAETEKWNSNVIGDAVYCRYDILRQFSKFISVPNY